MHEFVHRFLARRRKAGSRSADPRDGVEDRMPVDCYLGAVVPGGEPLQRDELALQERIEIRAIQLYLLRGVLNQHQGCKFMGARHLRFLGYRCCVCWGACMTAIAPLARSSPPPRSHRATASPRER